MAFEPQNIPEDGHGGGHLDEVPLFEILIALQGAQSTGRLTVASSSGENHMYFMRGAPVGVQLSEVLHPLGQLLLDLGIINGATFVRAQRLIDEAGRLPGQVFIELGALDEKRLNQVLREQARRKVEQFCRLGSRPFTFYRGLTFLAGFNSTPMDIYAVIFLAVREHLGPAGRASYLESLDDKQVRCGPDPLPAPAEAFGFGPSELKFLERLASGWQSVSDLVQTGSLPDGDVAVLLRFLDLLGHVQIEAKKRAPRPITAIGQNPLGDEIPALPDDDASPFADENAPGPARKSSPRPVTEPGVKSDRVAASKEVTDPRRNIHDVATDVQGAAVQQPPPSIIVSNEIKKPVQRPRKKRTARREEPLPSEKQIAVSTTRKEKTKVGTMPSIVIEDDL